jgi:hypothetical protein
MKQNNEFGQINIITDNIVEVVINQGVEITLEMVEVYENIIEKNITGNYGVLVNRINDYNYAFESLLCVGSAKNLKAAAIIFYAQETAEQQQSRNVVEQVDQLKVKQFSGLELGRESAITWLQQELSFASSPEHSHQTPTK